jgi:hypothetical protein
MPFVFNSRAPQRFAALPSRARAIPALAPRFTLPEFFSPFLADIAHRAKF